MDVEQGKVKLPPDLQLLYQREVDENKQVVSRRPIIVQRQPIITGSSLTSAEVRPDDQGGWLVAFALDSQGARAFGDFTGANIGRQLAIVLDDTVYSAPVIRSKIGEGRGQIEGSFTADSARDLAIVLRAGALPAPVKIIANLTVGPSLGAGLDPRRGYAPRSWRPSWSSFSWRSTTSCRASSPTSPWS